MRPIIRALIVATALGASMPALAATDEKNGYPEIVRGDYVKAEQIINQQRRSFARDPDLMLNLATVYIHTNRLREARDLYQAILSHPNLEMDMGDAQFVWSHALATAALRRLDQVQLTAR